MAPVTSFAFFAALTLGCATPAPTFYLEPQAADAFWSKGKPAVQRDSNGVRVTAAFGFQDRNLMAVRFQVENQTDDPFEVDPRNVHYAACSGTLSVSCTVYTRVYDPEAEIAQLEGDLRRERASASNRQAALGTLAVLSAMGDFASLASSRGNRRTGLATAGAFNLMAADAWSSEREMARLGLRRELLANHALRRTTLASGERADGIVLVPLHPKARFVWLRLRVGSEEFSFVYRQGVRRYGPSGEVVSESQRG